MLPSRRFILRILFPAILSLVASFVCHAQYPLVQAEDSVAFLKLRNRMDSIRAYRPTVAVVLSGGGAKSAAQIAPIDYLRKKDVPIDLILGSSMGGLVAGMVSVDMASSSMERLVKDLSWTEIVTDLQPRTAYVHRFREIRDRDQAVLTFGQDGTGNKRGFVPTGVSNGQNILNLVGLITAGYNDNMVFADLPVPFLSVSTDLINGRPKIFYDGSIQDAVMSTFAVPGLFSPRKDGRGRVLTDGAFYNNYPVDVARNAGADIVIGVDITATKLNADQVNTAGDALMQAFDMQGIDNYFASIEDTDLYLRPDIDDYGMLNMDSKSIDTLYARGESLVWKRQNDLDALSELFKGTEKDLFGVDRTLPKDYLTEGIIVSSISFKGATPDEESHLRQLARTSLYEGFFPVSYADAFMMAAIIRGTGLYEKVVFHFEGTEEPFRMVFECTRRPKNELDIGLRCDLRDYFALHAGILLGASSPGTLALDARLGMRSSLSAVYIWTPLIGLPGLYAGIRGGHLARTRGLKSSNLDETVELGHFSGTGEAGIVLDSWRTWSLKAGLRAEAFRFYSGDKYILPSYFASLGADTYDNAYFPRNGYRLDVSYSRYFKAGAGTYRGQVISAYAGAPISIKSVTIHPFARIRYVAGDGETPLHLLNAFTSGYAGRYFEGDIPFTGTKRNILFDDDLLTTVGTDLRVNFLQKHYAGARCEFACYPSFVPAASLYYAMNSPLGPLVRAGVEWSRLSGFGASVTIGTDF